MAAKKCPNCTSECPVASNSCKKCLHVFKSRKGSSTSSSAAGSSAGSPKQNTVSGNPNPTSTPSKQEQEQTDDLSSAYDTEGRRHTKRITRAKPNFYDSLHVEEQMKQQKLLLRKTKPKADGEDQPDDDQTSTGKEKDGTNSKTGESEPKKRRRGRPPGITTGRKTGIHIHTKSPSHVSKYVGSLTLEASGDYEKDLNKEDEDLDIMADISAEKALQYNIVLDEINRKWVSASWAPKPDSDF